VAEIGGDIVSLGGRLVEAIEQGKEHEMAIARNGRPAAHRVPIAEQPPERRIGVAKGAFDVPENIENQ
jgi:antitoxin (DNA-binding transcriptional repressor) of toxin-antitoxin stability system